MCIGMIIKLLITYKNPKNKRTTSPRGGGDVNKKYR